MKYRVPLSSGHWSAALPSIQVEDEMERRYVQVEGNRTLLIIIRYVCKNSGATSVCLSVCLCLVVGLILRELL